MQKGVLNFKYIPNLGIRISWIKVVVVFVLIFALIYLKTGLDSGLDVSRQTSDSSSFETATFSTARLMKKKALCGRNGLNNGSLTRKDWDLKLFSRPGFLKNFKNPCFYRQVTTGVTQTARLKLQCVPYFLIAGFPKAGTTDMWNRLLNHQDVALIHIKEPRFFNIGRYVEGNYQNASEKYISFFDKSAMEIQRRVAPLECQQHPFPYHHVITGEATVDTVFDNRFWPLVPGNERCTEPIITNADYVYQINPNMKVIFVVRNPVERLYSDYIYEARFLHYPLSPHLFHEAVIEAINNHTDCRKHATLRACAYNSSIETFKIRLRVGMYSIFLSDWLEVFPEENILVLKSEDTLGPKKFETYQRLFKFLNIRPFTKFEEVIVFQRGPINVRSPPEAELGDMLPETRSLIEQFYKPFNRDLVQLFADIDYNS